MAWLPTHRFTPKFKTKIALEVLKCGELARSSYRCIGKLKVQAIILSILLEWSLLSLIDDAPKKISLIF